MTKSPQTVTVIVPTRNAATFLTGCLDSIHKQTLAAETIVVDYCSSDDTLAVARAAGVSLVIELQDATGDGPYTSQQRNAGARAATGEMLVFLDADMELQPAVLEEAAQAIKGGAVAVILPEVTVGTGYWARVRAFERSFYLGDRNIEAARAYRRDVFDKLGGYDEALTAREDLDLSKRAERIGPVARTRSLVTHNEGGVSFSALMRKRSGYAAGNRDFIRKHGGAALAWNLNRAFVRRPWLLARQPMLGCGVIILKTAEAVMVIRAWLARGGESSVADDVRLRQRR